LELSTARSPRPGNPYTISDTWGRVLRRGLEEGINTNDQVGDDQDQWARLCKTLNDREQIVRRPPSTSPEYVEKVEAYISSEIEAYSRRVPLTLTDIAHRRDMLRRQYYLPSGRVPKAGATICWACRSMINRQETPKCPCTWSICADCKACQDPRFANGQRGYEPECPMQVERLGAAAYAARRASYLPRN
jgi:hypothetical protein